MPIIKTTINGCPAEMSVKSFYRHDRLIAAIDPDTEKSGLAVVVDGSIRSLEALEFYDLVDRLVELSEAGALVVLEDIDNSKPTYPRGTSQSVKNAISRKVGRAQHAARMIRKAMDRANIDIEYVLVAPLSLPEKRRSKNDGKFFNDLTGWAGGSNNDKRDAAMLGLYGLPPGYSVCDQQHAHAGAVCPSCRYEEQVKAARAARAKRKARV